MPKVKADVSEARSGLVTLKAGEYVVSCIKAGEPVMSTTGNPVIKIELKVLSGPDQGEDEEGKKIPSAEGRTLPPKSLPLNGKGSGILLNYLEAFEVPFTKRGDAVTFDPEEFVGKKARVGIGQRQYQGDTYPDVKRAKKFKA